MIELHCPNCGPRVVSEFSYLGETVERPDAAAADLESWRSYLYDHINLPTWTAEQWLHTAGCQGVIRLTRHLATNETRCEATGKTDDDDTNDMAVVL
jgi:sarcosine oxidase, subunit delta